MSNTRSGSRHDTRVRTAASPLHCLRWLLRLFSGSAAGAASIEQVIVAGLCALSGLLAFKHYGLALNADLRLQADRITGPGLPSASTFELSPEDLLAGLGSERDPGGPELCRLNGSCPRPGQCFAAGTLVATADGLRAIESIRQGERVWSRDVATGAVDLKPVTATFVRPDTPVIELELRSGPFLSERVSVTPGHRFWIEGSGWRRAASLATAPVGSIESPVSASALSTRGDATTVYNLEVEDFHSYFVGQTHALVHNGDGDDGEAEDPDDCDVDADAEAEAAAAKQKRMAEKAAERERQRVEGRREAALSDAIARADKPGKRGRSKRDDLTEEEREWLEEDPRNERLAVDPEGDGGYKVDEAKTGLAAERAGLVEPPVRRALRAADNSEAGADLIDGDSKKWDVKSGTDAAKVVHAANDGENVMVDCEGMSDAEVQALKRAVQSQLGPGAGDVIFVQR